MSTIGLNIAGGEFGGTAGTHNREYHYPTLAELQFYKSHGVDLIRVPFRWERVQEALDGPLDLAGDLALIKQVLVNAAALGMDVILDNHNYGRYKGVALGAAGGPTAAQFADFWQKMAAELKDYPALLGYDLMNEPHGMPTSTIWKESAQAATDAIRAVDMDRIIYVEGTGWSGAHSWLKFNSDLIINDPANKIVYQAHQYFDDDNSGTYNETYDGENAYPMVGVDRLEPFVEWLKANNLKGMIGEFGVPSNDPRWLEVQKNTLDYMQANGLDGTAWGGGTWWGTTYSMYTAKPGQADSAYMDLLDQYFNEYKDVFGATPSLALHTVAPTVSVSDVTTGENDGVMVFTIARSGDLSGASSVSYATANGTAVSGSDYTGATGTITFAAGQATATVTVPITNDTLVESPESFYLHLTGGSNVTIARGSGLGTINSDDAAPPPPPVAPTVAVNDVAISEGGGTLVFTVARSGDLSTSSSVNYGTANGTATAGSDYIAATGTVTFAAGQATATVTVQVTNDTLIENPETLFLNLTGGTNVTISDRQGVGTINSGDTATTPSPAGFPTRPTISGTDGNNNINARASTVDYVDAKGGDDVITGVGGRDYIDGGTGIDTISYHWSGAYVEVDLMRATQRNGDASGDVLVNIENVTGSARNDLIRGDNSANVLNGLGGQDTLTGRGGSDRFVFDSAVNANRDVVTDFASGDKLDFGLIDANANLVGNQAFSWLDTGAFTGTAGQLREYNQNGKHFVAGDTNGDRVADFIIEVAGKTDLTSADILF